MVETPSTHHLFFHSLPAGGDYHFRSYTVLLLAPSPPSSPTLHPTPEVLWHCSKEEECAGVFPTHPPHYCWNLACSVPPTWKKCPGVTPELKCHDLEIRRRKKKVFTVFHLKLISPVFHLTFLSPIPKNFLTCNCLFISGSAWSIPKPPTAYQGNPPAPDLPYFPLPVPWSSWQLLTRSSLFDKVLHWILPELLKRMF